MKTTNNIEMKKHYYINSFTGFENFLKTRITHIEESYEKENVLILTMQVNPTNDSYISRFDCIETIVEVNLVNDSIKIKPVGKGSRKYNSKIKYDVADIIQHLMQEASQYYTGDCAESDFITKQYYYNLLKENNATVETTNQFDYDCTHTFTTVEEVYNAFNSIMNELTTLQEVATTSDNTQDITENNQETSYTVFNRSFNSYDQALNYCNENDFSSEYIERVATVQPSTTQTIEEEKEIFYFYNQSFNTYSEAFNHAVNNMSPVTMILSSKHPTMNNERLKQLEHSYTFDKMKMAYDDMKEYYDYISSCPVTMDQENRYYKLKSWISRYENRIASIEATKQEKLQLAQKSNELLEYMISNGLELKELGSMVIYYYKGEKVHTWISGISIEEYAQGIEKVYNSYFKPLQVV